MNDLFYFVQILAYIFFSISKFLHWALFSPPNLLAHPFSIQPLSVPHVSFTLFLHCPLWSHSATTLWNTR